MRTYNIFTIISIIIIKVELWKVKKLIKSLQAARGNNLHINSNTDININNNTDINTNTDTDINTDIDTDIDIVIDIKKG